MKTCVAADGTATATRALALVALLAVGAHCALSNGLREGPYGSGGASAGGTRFAKLDKFMHDRMGLHADDRTGLAGDRLIEPPSADRGGGFSSAAVAAATSLQAVRHVDEDEDGDVDEDGGSADVDERDEDDDREPPTHGRPIRHSTSRRKQEFDPRDQFIQNQEPSRTMSPISENKWKQYGTRNAVEKVFQNALNKGTIHISSQGDKENEEVSKHQTRVFKETLCKVPRSRVVKIADHYSSSNKKYIPSCTVLHVCADDTGCCGSPALKCGPKSTEPVLLHFLVYTLPELSDRQTQNQSYQTLRFYNHTECQCQPKDDDLMPKDASMVPASMEAVNPPVAHRTNNDCKCPTEYTVRYLANGSCSCDCFDKQHECIRYKKGNIYFNFLDRYCITSGQCLMPMCEYGLYSHRTGRCPKKFETLYSFKNKHYF